MPFTPKFVDLVKNSTTVQGTGAVTLGAALSGFSGFAAVCAPGDQFYYCLQGIDKPAEREVGRGTFQADGTISRDAALGGPFKNFSSGTKTIALVAAAEWYARLEAVANAPPSSGGAPSPLFSAAAGSPIAAPVVAITTAGYSVNGIGAASYIYDAAVNAAYVTANPRTAFLAADSRGFKLDPAQRLTAEMFGAIPTTNDATTRATNDAAFKAACEFRTVAGSYYGAQINLGALTYYLGVTLEPEGAFRIVGQGGGHSGGGIAGVAQTRLIWPTDVCSIRVRAAGTDGTGVSAGKIAARDSYIQGISIEQATLGTNLNAHGVHMRGNATVRDCYILAAGDGIRIFADSSYVDPVTAGFADEWRVIECTILCGGDGIYTNGNEANAGHSQGVVFHQCGGCAIRDRSYLPNAHYSPQITGYGATGVQYLGRKYQLIIDSNTGTTPGTNANIWYDLGPLASPGGSFPAWNVATPYRAQLPFLIFNGSPMFGVYQEGGATVGHSSGLLVGGNPSATSLTNRLGTDSYVGLANSRGVGRLRTDGGYGSGWTSWATLGSGEEVSVGGLDNNNGQDGRASVLRYRSDVQGNKGDGDNFELRWQGTQDIAWDFGGRRMATLTGRNTAFTFGRSTAVPGMMGLQDFALIDPNDANNARIMGARNVAPASGYHAQGEFFWNVNPSSGGTLGWSCTTSGTPGTWTAVPVAGFTGTYSGDASFGNITIGTGVDGKAIRVQNTSGYGFQIAMNAATSTLYLDNVKPGTGFSDMNIRANNLSLYAGSATSPTVVLALDATGATVTGKVAASGAVTGSNLSGTNSGDQTISLTGDVSGSGTGSFATAIGANKVTNTMLAQVATGTFQARVSAATGNVETLTGTQATSLLDAVTSTAKGLAPASGGGTANFLRADGSWAAPASGSGTVTSASVTTANGISGTVATASTTPAITLSLGAIMPGSVAAVGAVTGSNLSGTNSGDQTITLTGDVTGSGTGSFAATIGANKVTFAKFVAASAASLVGATAAGNFAELTPASARGVLGLAAVATSGSASDLASGTLPVAATAALTGDVTKAAGASATTIAANNVTFAKFVAASQAAFVGATAAGNFGELTPAAATAQLSAMVGANGTIAGTKGLVPAPVATDNVKLLRGDGTWVAANAGTVTNVSVATANGVSGSVATASSTPAITLTLGAITPTSVAATGAITSSGGGVGYATGAGGTVTQATSRATGVTLSKSSGAITLFSATTTAGQTTTLTVTNSQVAATDTVIVSQASGTGVYFCAVSKVLAGSFNLSVYTPAAVGTAEAPALNFAVIKAVAA